MKSGVISWKSCSEDQVFHLPGEIAYTGHRRHIDKAIGIYTNNGSKVEV